MKRIDVARLLLVLAVPSASACASVSPIVRAQVAYDEARYENAIVWLDQIAEHGADADRLAMHDRVRFHFLRGMTEHRLGHRSEAIHHLAVAREVAGEDGVGLRHEQEELLVRTLGELVGQTPAAAEASAVAPAVPARDATPDASSPTGSTATPSRPTSTSGSSPGASRPPGAASGSGASTGGSGGSATGSGTTGSGTTGSGTTGSGTTGRPAARPTPTPRRSMEEIENERPPSSAPRRHDIDNERPPR